MEDAINSIYTNEKLPANPVLLTFDDGYIDHYNYAFPILDKYNIQGSFYISVKTAKERKLLDVNKLHYILSSEKRIGMIINEIGVLLKKYKNRYSLKKIDYYYDKLAKKNQYDDKNIIFVKRLLQKELCTDARSKILDKLFIKFVNDDQDVISNELYMNEEQIRFLVRSGMHVGCHGYDHLWWNSLSKKEVEHEVVESKKFLNSINVDMNYWTASYPYGSYDIKSSLILKENGCKLAVTADSKISILNSKNRFFLPRIDANNVSIMMR
jgi:peptidoglycan/xylan/chitin deacetylase (PgdA/CDA1 family)